MCADDLINYSQSHRVGMQRILSLKHSKMERLVNKILETKYSMDISKIEMVSPFCQEVIQKLDLGKNWLEVDEAKILKEQVKSLNSNQELSM
jgi:hypothetical protein